MLSSKCHNCSGKGKIHYHENKICKKCGGSGKRGGKTCSNCKGAGIFMSRKSKTCPVCYGSGKGKKSAPKKPPRGRKPPRKSFSILG